MLYPLKFKPVYKDIIWGGSNIKSTFEREDVPNKVAESWELCCREDGMGVVSNGALAGCRFDSLIDTYGEQLLGKKVVSQYGLRFPLLVKLIDANDRLSVQVHPDDEGARLEGEPNGKNEIWYVIDAKPGAKLICGLADGTTREEFIQSVDAGSMAGVLKEISVRSGDCIFIEAGTVHAILDGILIAEIQQNSNTTYRIYDWGRVDKAGKGRELHIDKALKAIRFDVPPKDKIMAESVASVGHSSRELLRSKFFNLDEINVDSEYICNTQGSFLAVVVLSGSGSLSYEDVTLPVRGGESVLIPACLREVKFTGNLKFLRASI